MPELESLKNLLEDIIDFLQYFHWLHDFPMIRILSDNTLEKLPEDWKHWFINSNYDIVKLLSPTYKTIDCPSLKEFLLKCKQYSIVSLLQTRCQTLSFESVLNQVSLNKLQNNTENSSDFESLSSSTQTGAQQQITKKETKQVWKILKRVTPKKKHEIEQLDHFINDIKSITKSDKILDIGSGLGYLDLFLHLKYKYKLIGVEGSVEKVESAYKLRDQCFGKECSDVHYIPLHLEDDSNTLKKSKEIINNLSSSTLTCSCGNKKKRELASNGSKGVDLLSLHSCADLSPIMLKIFADNYNLSSIVLISCCYHKMEPLSETTCSEEPKLNYKANANFKNFPLSRHLNEIMEEKNFRLNTFGLRLASEESVLHWQNRSKDCLLDDVRSIAYRGILQNICEKNKIGLKKLRRRCAKKSSYTSFEEYIDLVCNDYEFKTIDSENCNYELLRSQLIKEHLEYKESVFLIGLVRALQLSLQTVLESLILIDRVVYLREKDFALSGLVQLFDEVQSPRSKAIFGFRDEIWWQKSGKR